ncbi:MAG: transketolase [Candidatus Gastranaerophilales bacterium]|nr:transketolase [Candidatus Gastranaerophilales bacterium]
MLKKLSSDEIKEIQEICKKERREILSMIFNAKSGHPGGSLSAIDILTVLYTKVMKHFPECEKNPNYNSRDRFILSKGHASAALYAVLAHCGYIQENELMGFRKMGSILQGHPSCKLVKGVEVSTGSLGQGLSMACGMALGLRLDNINNKIFVLMGDGELQEGSVWEAAMQASARNLKNIIAIVDRNKLQIDGSTEDVMAIGSAADKFKAFGWNTMEINGHNIEEIYEALETAKLNDKPTAIIANTIKGKGVSFMENNPAWHGKVPSNEQFETALAELT